MAELGSPEEKRCNKAEVPATALRFQCQLGAPAAEVQVYDGEGRNMEERIHLRRGAPANEDGIKEIEEQVFLRTEGISNALRESLKGLRRILR